MKSRYNQRERNGYTETYEDALARYNASAVQHSKGTKGDFTVLQCMLGLVMASIIISVVLLFV